MLNVLLERLRNEITRLTAVKAFFTIASSPTKLSSVLTPVIMELTSFLRKVATLLSASWQGLFHASVHDMACKCFQANRTLRQASLDTLNALIISQKDNVAAESLEALIEEASSLVDDSDLHLAASALRLCKTLVACQPAAANAVCSKVVSHSVAKHFLVNDSRLVAVFC